MLYHSYFISLDHQRNYLLIKCSVHQYSILVSNPLKSSVQLKSVNGEAIRYLHIQIGGWMDESTWLASLVNNTRRLN